MPGLIFGIGDSGRNTAVAVGNWTFQAGAPSTSEARQAAERSTAAIGGHRVDEGPLKKEVPPNSRLQGRVVFCTASTRRRNMECMLRDPKHTWTGKVSQSSGQGEEAYTESPCHHLDPKKARKTLAPNL